MAFILTGLNINIASGSEHLAQHHYLLITNPDLLKSDFIKLQQMLADGGRHEL